MNCCGVSLVCSCAQKKLWFFSGNIAMGLKLKLKQKYIKKNEEHTYSQNKFIVNVCNDVFRVRLELENEMRGVVLFFAFVDAKLS
jgi:hypothetical protein